MLVASHVCYCDLLLTCMSLQMQECWEATGAYLSKDLSLFMAITITVLSGFSAV